MKTRIIRCPVALFKAALFKAASFKAASFKVALFTVALFASTLTPGTLTAAPTTRPATAATTKPAAQTPAVGDKAPDFALDTLDGQTVHLTDLTTGRGPVVLVVLRGWPGYQCPVCTKQCSDLFAQAKKFAEKNARVLLVYPGPSDKLKAHAKDFMTAKTLPEGFQFVIDPDYTFTNAYGLRWNAPQETAFPSTFVIDAQNIIRFEKISTTHAGRATSAEILKALGTIK